MSSDNYDGLGPHLYGKAFATWVNDVRLPDAFVTIRFPNIRRMQRSELFYLRFLARCAEADVLGRRTLKWRDDGGRIRWIARREVAEGLIHYHALVNFTTRLWRRETPPGFDDEERCSRFEHALIRAGRKVPQLFKRLVTGPSVDGGDIKVIPAAERHAEYLLKGMRRPSYDDPERVSEYLLRDSGLIFLP
jgi:hypothetical protein